MALTTYLYVTFVFSLNVEARPATSVLCKSSIPGVHKMAHLSTNISDTAVLLVSGSAIYAFLLFVYRLTLSPLAKFPGPKLAAASHFYEFYYDVVKYGRYEFKIQELHAKYGPIIRINPEELHIDDPDFHSQLYVGSNVRKSDRPVSVRNQFFLVDNMFATVEHDLHRKRRKALEPFFSKKKITELEPVIQSKARRLSERLLLLKGTRTPVSLVYPFSAATGDIISNYCFGESWEALEKEDFNATAHRIVETYLRMTHLFRQFPWTGRTLMRIPKWMIRGSGAMAIAKCTEQVERKIASVMHDPSSDDKDSSTTIFHELLKNSALPPQELTEQRLLDEGVSLNTAGVVTTAPLLTFISYYLLSQPETLARLQTELAPLMVEYPTKIPRLAELEALPYLNAVVTEGLRMNAGGPHRIQRVFPEEDLKYKEWNIPAGVRNHLLNRITFPQEPNTLI